MKPLLKTALFLGILSLLDFLFRKGLLGFFIPFDLPLNANIMLLYSIFALLAWWLTKKFAASDHLKLNDFGINWKSKNRYDFLLGLLLGIFLWGIVSLLQSYIAGFSWQLRENISLLHVIYGLVFIFIADLGTELFTRGYPLKTLEQNYGSEHAISLMVAFVSLKSFSFQAQGELLLYTILIPALHTVFFSILYFKTGRLGAALGLHTGTNFVTISIFDLRTPQIKQAIPSGIFQSDTALDQLSLTALQLPWVVMAFLFSLVLYFWWQKPKSPQSI